MKLMKKFNLNRRCAIRLVILLLIIWACALISGCDDSAIIWSAQAKSPDGLWIANAKTKQWSGPGNAYVATSVTLEWTPNLRRPSIEVLGFSNKTAYPLGITAVKMEWINSSHLDVVYNGNAEIDFQAIKAAGLEITAHRSSGTTLK